MINNKVFREFFKIFKFLKESKEDSETSLIFAEKKNG